MRNKTRFGWAMGAAAVIGLVAAAEGHAQFCAGYPTSPGESSIGGKIGFPSGGASYGLEGSYNFVGPLAAFASFNLLVPDNDNADNINVFGGGVAYDIAGFVPAIPAGLSVCPVAAVGFSSVNGATTLTVPVGVGFGTEFGADGITVMPYAIPQFVLTRFSARNVDVLSDTNFGVEAGFLSRFGQFYAGVSLNRLFIDAADTNFTIRAGMTLGQR